MAHVLRGERAVREKIAAFQRSGVGRFLKKFSDDRGTDLAVLLAWGTLNTLFPLLLGFLAVAGLILRDPRRLQDFTATLLMVLPGEVATPLGKVLDDTQKGATVLGLVGLALLLWNGSGFFANMESIFNRAYHVADRNLLAQRFVALGTMVAVSVLLTLSTAAYGIGSVLSSASDFLFQLLPFEVPGRGLVGSAVGWTISLLLTGGTFLLLYTVLPNRPLAWRRALPGAVAVTALFLGVLQVFPLYLLLFGKGFQTYAVFGMFLLLMFWAYLIGLMLVFGAELNAYLENPRLADQPGVAEPDPKQRAERRAQAPERQRRRGLSGPGERWSPGPQRS